MGQKLPEEFNIIDITKQLVLFIIKKLQNLA